MSGFHETCLLSAKCLTVTDNGSDKDSSCSGIIIDAHKGLILTHSSLFLPFLERHDPSVWIKNKLQEIECTVFLETVTKRKSSGDLNNILSGKMFQPYMEAVKSITSNALMPSYHSETETMGEDLQPEVVSFKAEVQHMFNVESFRVVLEKLMPRSEGWQFDENLANDDVNKVSNSELHDLHRRLMSVFFVLQLKGWKASPQSRHPKVYPSHKLRIGDPVLALNTPFGDLCPAVFLNSISRGVLSNVAGNSNGMLLTDARCLSGSQGGGLYVEASSRRLSLVGVIVAPLCWKAGEWVGLTIVCSASEIFNALSASMPLHLPHLYGFRIHKKHGLDVKCDHDSLCLIQCEGGWGSGVIIQPEQGLILTCAHVIKYSKQTTVRVFHGHEVPRPACVVYCSEEGQIFDLAILKITPPLNGPNSWKKIKQIRLGYPTEGESVQVLGHGCFGAACRTCPSVTQGVVSKVTRINDSPILIQSSCAVHGGSSGGVLVSHTGSVLGMVTCNAKDDVTGAAYPHINLSVPMWSIWPAIQQYIQTQDSSCLNNLVTNNTQVINAWALKNPDIGSKL